MMYFRQRVISLGEMKAEFNSSEIEWAEFWREAGSVNGSLNGIISGRWVANVAWEDSSDVVAWSSEIGGMYRFQASIQLFRRRCRTFRRSSSLAHLLGVCAWDACCTRARLMNCQMTQTTCHTYLLLFFQIQTILDEQRWRHVMGLVCPVSAKAASSLAISRWRLVVDVTRNGNEQYSSKDIQKVLTSDGFIIRIWCLSVRIPVVDQILPFLYGVTWKGSSKLVMVFLLPLWHRHGLLMEL